MKQMMIKIGVVIIGSILVLASNSFAFREMHDRHQNGRGEYSQKWDKPMVYQHGKHHHKSNLHPPGLGLWHKHHGWQRRPVYRHGHPGHYDTHPRRIVVKEVNNYYNSAESYAYPENEYNASASVSNSGFSFSIGVSKTD